MDWTWYFDYDQCPIDACGVYLFDHEPVEDGHWRPIHNTTNACYRVLNGTVQVVKPGQMLTCSDVQACHRWLEQSGPLPKRHELEIQIARHPEGFEMWSHWLLDRRDGVVFADFTPREFSRAYERLCETEEEVFENQ